MAKKSRGGNNGDSRPALSGFSNHDSPHPDVMDVFYEDPKLLSGMVDLLTKRLSSLQAEHDENMSALKSENTKLSNKTRQLEATSAKFQQEAKLQSRSGQSHKEAQDFATLQQTHKALQLEYRGVQEEKRRLAELLDARDEASNSSAEHEHAATISKLRLHLNRHQESQGWIALSSFPTYLVKGSALSRPLPEIVAEASPDVNGAIQFARNGAIYDPMNINNLVLLFPAFSHHGSSMSWRPYANDLIAGQTHETTLVTDQGSKYIGTYKIAFTCEVLMDDIAFLSPLSHFSDGLIRCAIGTSPQPSTSLQGMIRNMLHVGLLRVRCIALQRIGLNKTLEQRLIEASPAVIAGHPGPQAQATDIKPEDESVAIVIEHAKKRRGRPHKEDTTDDQESRKAKKAKKTK